MAFLLSKETPSTRRAAGPVAVDLDQSLARCDFSKCEPGSVRGFLVQAPGSAIYPASHPSATAAAVRLHETRNVVTISLNHSP